MNVMLGQPPAAEEPTGGGRAAATESALSSERPFPGLRPFVFADRDFFFGRESQAFTLYRFVENGRFVAVVGGSGSGKSSLVLAGLCDLLDQETNDRNGPSWVCRDMRPGGAPIRRLAATLAKISARDDADWVRLRDRIDYRLRQSSFSLERALEEAGGLGGRHLLLIVDQFEELFRFGLGSFGQRRGAAEAKARDEATLFVQILLDADRRRLPNVHVLVTMRSDFIGECANFTGLPEAVSATQYLVPGLTRTQLEEVIRGPIEKAGGLIEPELVERLLNDCGELDPLPVLQHCLMRLWDRARAASLTGPRCLTRQTYDDIGRLTEALSQHADEVMRECEGKSLAVEQVFRALSELDREGRAIRRGCRFEKLLAETGVAEADLRDVLDRFRAATCSFLVPPPSAAATLAHDDIVDIGHEALLRRWKKLSGDALAKESAPAKAVIGWLAEEQADGQRYRTLASLLDEEKASLTEPQKTKRWWDSRPRTAAWADRYGGRFEAVKTLIDDNIAAKRRSRRQFWALVVSGVFIGIFTVGMIVKSRIDAVKEQQEAIDRGAMTSAKELLVRVTEGYNKGTINQSAASGLASALGEFLRDLHNSTKTNGADRLWAESLNIESDFETISNDIPQSLKVAREAKSVALPLVKANHRDPEALQLLFETSIRVGDALVGDPLFVGSGSNHAQKDEDFEGIFEEYNVAMAAASDLLAIGDTQTGEDDVIRIHQKIGDIYKKQKLFQQALVEYDKAIDTVKTALSKFPQSIVLLRERGASYYRKAALLEVQAAWLDAEKALQVAEDDQKSLVQLDPNDLSKLSNLAATYTLWGEIARDQKEPEVALFKFQKGVAIQEELVKKDPTNPQWKLYLAPSYERIARMLDDWEMHGYALVYFQKSLEARLDIVLRDTGNADWLKKFAIAAGAVGDHSSGALRIDPYRRAVKTWKRIVNDPKAVSIEASYYDDLSRFGDALAGAKEWYDAMDAYAVAEKIARMNFATNPSDPSLRAKADRAAAGAEAAEKELAGRTDEARQ